MEKDLQLNQIFIEQVDDMLKSTPFRKLLIANINFLKIKENEISLLKPVQKRGPRFSVRHDQLSYMNIKRFHVNRNEDDLIKASAKECLTNKISRVIYERVLRFDKPKLSERQTQRRFKLSLSNIKVDSKSSNNISRNQGEILKKNSSTNTFAPTFLQTKSEILNDINFARTINNINTIGFSRPGQDVNAIMRDFKLKERNMRFYDVDPQKGVNDAKRLLNCIELNREKMRILRSDKAKSLEKFAGNRIKEASDKQIQRNDFLTSFSVSNLGKVPSMANPSSIKKQVVLRYKKDLI